MYKFVKQLEKQLEESTHLTECPFFDIEVLDTNGETDYITCDIFFKGNSIIAERDAVSIKEQNSKYVATSRVVCDSAYTLDQHLECLFDKVTEEICQGELYELAN